MSERAREVVRGLAAVRDRQLEILNRMKDLVEAGDMHSFIVCYERESSDDICVHAALCVHSPCVAKLGATLIADCVNIVTSNHERDSCEGEA
jgi:hypothetical protein